jgi:uncharacterized SAM-binding protein YcdF (DUF218 family)
LGLGPVLLALMIPILAPKRRAREVHFFLVSIVLVYLCSTMITPRWLLDWIDPRIAAGIRHPGVMAGMAGPLILALAAWSMDRLEIFLASSGRIFVRSFGLFLIVALAAISLMMAYVSSRRWLNLESFAVEETVIEMVQPPSQQWVQISDEHYWNVLAFDRGIRLTGTFHPWHFADKPAPPPALILTRDPNLPGTEPLSSQFTDLYIRRYPENHYAAVNIGGQAVVCPAQATGGLIRVTCDIPANGTLVVMEHTWPGWSASIDGVPAQLHGGQWLSVDLVKGSHSIEFRYLPWDVPLGLGISLIGLVLLGLWWKKRIW